MADMRTAYREHLEAFNRDLLQMCDTVREVMQLASTALLEQSLEDAEHALNASDPLKELTLRSEERSMSLLALENPVAGDLRQVLSSIYIVENFSRMGAMAKHIAKLARLRHPYPVLPNTEHAPIAEMAARVDEMVNITHDLLLDPDPDVAVELNAIDEGVDDLHDYLNAITTSDSWEHSAREAVDVALVSRYYERYADRCVNVAGRVVFLVTGLNPKEYMKQRDEDAFDRHSKLTAIERRFRSKK